LDFDLPFAVALPRDGSLVREVGDHLTRAIGGSRNPPMGRHKAGKLADGVERLIP
jgi:hypothetical protein